MIISDIIKQCEVFYSSYHNDKTLKIIEICKSFLKFQDFIQILDRKIGFPDMDKNISYQNIINDAFLSKLASVEFGLNGWVFAGGSHKPLTEKTAIESEKFAELYAEKFKNNIILATGASGGFMESVNSGYIKAGNNAITSTTRFTGLSETINDKIKYCFIASTFSAMEAFLIQNAIAGVFFDGGIGTAYEVFSMLCERQRGSIAKDTPMIFVKTENENSFYNDIRTMQQECETSSFNIMHQSCKIYPEDSKNIYSVNTVENAIEILNKYIEEKVKFEEDLEHDFIRKIFEVGENRFVGR